MTEVDDPFLAQIESFAIAPPEKRLIDDESVLPSSISSINYEFAKKISSIHTEKQQKNLRSDVIVPSGGMVAAASGYEPKRVEKISNDQVNDWKAQVLQSTRPRNQWTHSNDVEESKAYARAVAAQMQQEEAINQPIRVTTEHTKSPSSSTIESYPSPMRNGKTIIDTSDKYSDYSSASSHKSPSPSQSSPNSASDYSVTISPYHRSPVSLSSYESKPTPSQPSKPIQEVKKAPPPAVPKKTVTIVEGAKIVPLPPKKVEPPRQVFHGGLRSQTRSANFNPLRLPMDTSNYTWKKNGEDQPNGSRDDERRDNGKWERRQEIIEEEDLDMDDPARRGVVRVVLPQRDNDSTSSSRPHSSASTTHSNDSVNSALQERCRKKWAELVATVEEEEDEIKQVLSSERSSPSSSSRGPIVVPAQAPSASVIGDCMVCHKRVLSTERSTTVERQLVHDGCFNCNVCRRHLGDRQHVYAKGKLYCEEDFRFTGMNETTEKCAKCSTPIVDMVLQALGRSFHPACFRCTKCRCCLDGIPFALDGKGEVYCMPDYHSLFAPRCASCTHPILPDPKTGETIRVVAINNDYHVECYTCEGCSIRLADDSNSKCYPLGKHLLCYDCHLLWRRTGGETQPITDL
ncbi:hypothetical protein PRIPAC_84326 [Pristionchus pacificus]|uniref:LIM domain containing protein n=1 Tax=Pristionchus pacificus TaxID=54126 RepID=A0A2A6BL10_PRIPA|nr:hypothetical protein PRIPAC_84326 [Pristionchus pacificus]|eukprot:PDM66612.1 LIM domain containing protein [Pristionchus pacificus]